MKWHQVRNLALLLVSLSCLGFAGAVAYKLFVTPETVDIPIGGPFELSDTDGQTVTDRTFRGRYMLIYFGYTYCPDACPTTLAEMTGALDAFAQGAPRRAASVVPIFISVDPERDSPQVLREYRKSFHPRLVALTGTSAQIHAAAKAYRVYFAKAYLDETDRAAKTYVIDHSTYVYLMGPDGRYLTMFTATSTAETMARRLEEIVK